MLENLLIVSTTTPPKTIPTELLGHVERVLYTKKHMFQEQARQCIKHYCWVENPIERLYNLRKMPNVPATSSFGSRENVNDHSELEAILLVFAHVKDAWLHGLDDQENDYLEQWRKERAVGGQDG